MDRKIVEKPQKYNGDIKNFITWQGKMKNYLNTQDFRWKAILDSIEEFGSTALKVDDYIKIARKNDIVDHLEIFSQQLFMYLDNFTESTANLNIITNGEEKSFETWRKLSDLGRSRRPEHLLKLHSEILHPAQNLPVKNLEVAIQTWEANVLYFETIDPNSQKVDEREKRVILRSMCPKDLREHLEEECSKFDTYEKIKTEIGDWVHRKIGVNLSGAIPGALNILGEPSGAAGEEDAFEFEFSGDVYADHAMLVNALVNKKILKPGKGSGYGKGKGKAGLKGGKGDSQTEPKTCHNCGSPDHFIRDCPQPKPPKGDPKGKGSGRGKGGGKYGGYLAYYPWRDWKNWQGWFPSKGEKGAGKSEQVNVLSPGQRLSQLAQQAQDSYWNQEQHYQGQYQEYEYEGIAAGKGKILSLVEKKPDVRKSQDNPGNQFESYNKEDIMKRFTEVKKRKMPKVSKWKKLPREDTPKELYSTLCKFQALRGDDEHEASDVDAAAPATAPAPPSPIASAVPRKRKKADRGTIKAQASVVDEVAFRKPCGCSGEGLCDSKDDEKSSPPRDSKLKSVVPWESTLTSRRAKLQGIEAVRSGDEATQGGNHETSARTQALNMFVKMKEAKEEQERETLNVVREGGWEKIRAIVDSGASVPVFPPWMGKDYEVRESRASKAGVRYQVANGAEVDNLGEKIMPVMTREGTMRGYISQIADVTSALQSVRHLHASGHVVVFDGPDSFMLNKLTGEANKIEDDGTSYVLETWVVPPDDYRKMTGQDFGRPHP